VPVRLLIMYLFTPNGAERFYLSGKSFRVHQFHPVTPEPAISCKELLQCVICQSHYTKMLKSLHLRNGLFQLAWTSVYFRGLEMGRCRPIVIFSSFRLTARPRRLCNVAIHA